jgi:4-amino-4-deoxy-L-arabinose transferase-like glycosyltransferase
MNLTMRFAAILSRVRPHMRSVVLFSAAVAAATYCLLLAVAPPEPVPEPFAFPASVSWITTSATDQSTGCFRIDLSIPGTVANAWITLASNGGFEVLANGRPCAKDYVGSPVSPFQQGLSELGQKLTPADPAISINYPREYQWAHHDTAELPIWIDLTNSLHPGHNALCVEIETAGTSPAMILSGEVLLSTGERIPIRSGSDWAAEPVPTRLPQYAWTDAESTIFDWRRARVLDWHRTFWRLVPQGVFEEPFRGKRVRVPVDGPPAWLEQTFNLPGKPTDGFLRIVTDSPFQIWINEHPVIPNTRSESAFASGPWFIREIGRSPLDVAPEATAEWLDSSQVATLLPGEEAETPLRADPAVNQLSPDSRAINANAEHPITSGESAPSSNSLTNGSQQKSSPYADIANPERVIPPALTRSSRDVEFQSYSVGPFLRPGKNLIRIGLYKDRPEGTGLSRESFLAFDGVASLPGGDNSFFRSDESLRSFCGKMRTDDALAIRTDVDEVVQPSLLPTKRFYGFAYPDRPWFSVAAALFFACSCVLLLCATNMPRLAFALERCQIAAGVMAGWIAGGILLRAAMLERSEALYFRLPVAALLLLVTGLAGAVIVGLRQSRVSKEESISSPRTSQGWLMPLVRKWGWPVLVGSAIILCFVLRAWQIDIQPPDDDEYASIQASLAIAQKGVPEFQEGVWYTRSPLYHYLAGAVAAVSGDNIYSLRLLTVFFSCASAVLLWKMARELTHDRSLALCALVLYAIHPYAVFTGHVARFYQQQEFLHLLGLCFFVRGFILNTGMRDRYLTVVAFLGSVLSQEITALQIFPLAICWILFGKRRSWQDEVRLLVAVGCALAVIGLDYAFFKIKCLTALEGVSPRIEARIGWCFEKPSNFLTMLIGYSRLHLVLSAFLIPGFIVSWRRQKTLWSCLYIYFFLSIIVINLLITNKGFRYEYYLIPLWILLSVYGMGECAKLMIPAWRQINLRRALGFGWIAIAICSWSPWRIINSYDSGIGADPMRALRFVAANLRSGDRIVTSEPHPAAALLDTGQSDYDLSVPILHDFALRKQGKLVDRSSASEVIGNLDELQQAVAKNDRLWIVCSRELMHARGENILWQFPGARVQVYLRNNCRLAFRSYLWSVYLWDRSAGHYSSFREKPADWFE